ncbi:MAG: DUF6252 family protein [Mucilaginibacter sp.]
MNKLRLLTFLVLATFFIQSCKKDTVVGVAYTTAAFQANINGSTWAPDTISSTMTYNSATQTKVFKLMGTKDQKQVIISVTLNNASSDANIPTGVYNVDAAGNVTIQYNTQQKNSSGEYVFLPHGTVSPGSGSITVTTVDPVAKQITGIFSFYSRTTNYDGAGNVLSISVDNILGGEYTKLPYTFTSN